MYIINYKYNYNKLVFLILVIKGYLGHWTLSGPLFFAHFEDDSTQEAVKVRKTAKIRNQFNQVPHLTQDTHWKVTKSQ